MARKRDEWCECDDQEDGVYYYERGEANNCSCPSTVPHIHCVNCGGLTQVS